MNALIASLLALSSTIDSNVKLVYRTPQPGSQAWPSVGFNDYSYTPGKSPAVTEARTRAMADIFGQASRVLATEDKDGTMSVRTFYKNKEGANTPSLHISQRPAAPAGAVVDVNEALAKATEQAAALGIEFDNIPSAISGSPGAFLGYLRGKIAQRSTAQLAQEVANTPVVEVDDAPPV